MHSLRLVTLLLTGLFHAPPAQAQDNPLHLLFPDTFFLIEIPAGLDIRDNLAELEIGAKLDTGEELSYIADLTFVERVEAPDMGVFSIPADDLPKFHSVVEQMDIWTDEGKHGNAIFELNFKICRYGPLPSSSVFVFGMVVEHIEGSLMRFGGLDFTDPDSQKDFTNEVVPECAEKP